MRACRLTSLLAALALAGCGAERTPPPSLAEPLPVPGRPVVDFPAAGLRVALPGGWLRTNGPDPLVVSVASSRALMAVWRYPRAEPLPADEAALGVARDTLLAAAKARDPTFRETSSRVRRIAGRPAIEVRGTGTVDGRRRRLRSVHVYAFGAEVVVDAYAPEDQFEALDRDVVRPALRSLEVRQP